MKRLLSLIALILWTAPLALATTHAITPTGSGAKTGADWNNACQGFAGNCAGSAMVRGDTYYVAGGSGGAYTNSANAPVLKVSTAVSGTTLITIKAATIADHGPSTGWVNTLAVDGGAGQADFVTAGNAVFEASTSYVVFDGNFPASDTSSTWANPGNACGGTQCGILIDQRVSSAASVSTNVTYGLYIDDQMTNVTLRSTEYFGPGLTAGHAGISTDMIHAVYSTQLTGNHTITHNYMHDSSQDYSILQNVSGITWEWNYFYKNFSSVVAPALHGACISFHGGVNNMTVAFNAFRDMQGTGCLSLVGGGPTTNDNVQFYGNILWLSSGNPNGITGGYDNGIVSCTNGQVCTNWKVYNNTIVNETLSLNNSLNGGTPGAASSIQVYNNLFFNSGSANNQCVNWTLSCVNDYNSYSGTTQNTPGAHDQTIVGNPFACWTCNTTAGFQLTTDTAAWNFLGSPFNVDLFGVTRTTSRGALQFPTSGTPVISFSPSPVNFPTTPQGNSSLPISVTMTNTGTATMTISSISFTTGNSGDFSQTNTCGASLASAAHCTVSVTFTPGGSGARTSLLTVAGTVTASDTVNGTAGASIPAVPTGLTATPSGATVNVSWTASTGTPTGYFLSRSSVSGGPYTQIANVINGATSYADTGLANNTYFYVITAYNGAGTSANSSQASATVSTACSINLNPSSLAFGQVPLGTPATNQSFVVTNVGTASCTSLSIASPSGPNAADFGQTNTCGSSLAVNANCLVTVSFTPSTTTAETAAIVVTSSDPNSPDTELLSGSGVGAVSITPSSLNFGNVYSSKVSSAQVVTYQNNSGAIVTFTSVTLATGTQFAIGTNTCTGTLVNGASCTTAVTFQPTSNGNKSDTLIFTDSASGSPHNVALSGSAKGHKILRIGAVI